MRRLWSPRTVASVPTRQWDARPSAVPATIPGEPLLSRHGFGTWP